MHCAKSLKTCFIHHNIDLWPYNLDLWPWPMQLLTFTDDLDIITVHHRTKFHYTGSNGSRDINFYPVNYFLVRDRRTERRRCITPHYVWALSGWTHIGGFDSITSTTDSGGENLPPKKLTENGLRIFGKFKCQPASDILRILLGNFAKIFNIHGIAVVPFSCRLKK